MSLIRFNHVLLPDTAMPSAVSSRARLAAFVPIALALLGVAAILFGGLSARGPQTAAVEAEVDPVITGAIASLEEQRRVLEMLDR